jgi:5-methylcytosine-specific restriction endonuclease McrA
VPKDPNDYKKYRAYYLARESSPEGLKKRKERAEARADALKRGLLTGPHDPREVDHKKSLSKGGGNARSNLQVITQLANRKKYNH